MSMRDFGVLVAERRQALGLKSCSALATKAKVNRSVVYNIENANVQDIEVATFLKIAKALKWTPEEAVSAYLGQSMSAEKLKRERLHQITTEYLTSLTEAKLIELKQ